MGEIRARSFFWILYQKGFDEAPLQFIERHGGFEFDGDESRLPPPGQADQSQRSKLQWADSPRSLGDPLAEFAEFVFPAVADEAEGEVDLLIAGAAMRWPGLFVETRAQKREQFAGGMGGDEEAQRRITECRSPLSQSCAARRR